MGYARNWAAPRQRKEYHHMVLWRMGTTRQIQHSLRASVGTNFEPCPFLSRPLRRSKWMKSSLRLCKVTIGCRWTPCLNLSPSNPKHPSIYLFYEMNSRTQSTSVAQLVLCTRVSTLHVSKSPTECSFWQLGSQKVTPNNGR